MSLFLGKIHYWLYNKILKFEAIEREIIRWSTKKDLGIEVLIKSIQETYGEPLDNRPLESIIDTSNIHGWLQNKISNAEIRHAAIITEILKVNKEYKTDLANIFEVQGKIAAEEYKDYSFKTPEEVYNALNDILLEGMPCDRVSMIIESNDMEFIWETTACLHKPYWDRIGGDVNDFYILREFWIKSFIGGLKPGYKYERTKEGINKILKL